MIDSLSDSHTFLSFLLSPLPCINISLPLCYKLVLGDSILLFKIIPLLGTCRIGLQGVWDLLYRGIYTHTFASSLLVSLGFGLLTIVYFHFESDLMTF